MPSGDEGTLEALKCSACNCHRNFHRKVIESESSDQEKCFSSQNHFLKVLPVADQAKPTLGQYLIPPKKSGSSAYDDHSYEKERKRFRTKFSQEQKEKMLRFAEKAGWRIQKLDESLVQQFCQEIGIKRRVLKVWMHNNKNTFVKRNFISSVSPLEAT
ncbi:hypothetical protein L6164_008243 [Bauhinia variegata]|nr:hypothetical protein L6164_008243 [Bauhinia variegata]